MIKFLPVECEQKWYGHFFLTHQISHAFFPVLIGWNGEDRGALKTSCQRWQSFCWPGSLNDCPEQGLPCLLPPRTTPDSLPLPTSCSLCQQNRNPYMKPWNSEFSLFQPGVYFMKREWKLKSGDPSRSRPPSKNQERSLAMISCGYFCCVFFFLKFAKVKCFSYKW